MNLRHISAIAALALAACSSEAIKSSTYEALHHKGCIDRAGTPFCDPQHKSYEQYQKERDAALKPQS
jgi:hypothetical protein